MTLRDVFEALSGQPLLLFLLLSAIPTGAFLINLWSGETAEDIWKWRYVYSVLVYLACIPGIFAFTLNIYLFLFERQSIWDMNLALQVLPILTMTVTLILIRRKLPFNYIPGFGKLSSFLTLGAAIMGILWFIDRTRIYAITYVPFTYIVVGFVALLLIIRFAGIVSFEKMRINDSKVLAGYIVLLAFCSVLSGCRLPNESPVTPDQNYFPLETGRYIIYEVQENLYALHSEPVQRSYQLKEVTGAAYTDVTGQTAFPLRRYRRANANQLWQADSLWSARLASSEAIRTENSQDVVSLLIPISNGLRWNGNRHNSYDVEMYEARNVDQPFRVLTKLFNETATVVAQDDSTLVSQEKRLAVYAREVGLVYKEQTSLQFCTATQACIGKNQIDYGIQQIYRIQTYGKE